MYSLNQPYTLDNIFLHRQDDALTFTIHNPKEKEYRLYMGSRPAPQAIETLLYEGSDSSFTLSLPRHAQLYYFKLEGDGMNSRLFGERVLPLDGAINIRDIGGYKTKDGKFVKWGMLYRGDQLKALTPDDMKLLAESGLRGVIDYRSSHEMIYNPNRLPPSVARIAHCDPSSVMSEAAGSAVDLNEENQQLITALEQGDIPEEELNGRGQKVIRNYENLILSPLSQQAYRKMFHALLEPDQAPWLQHCRGGKDRTGVGVALLLLALGVDEDRILEDYALTDAIRQKRNALKMEQYRALTQNQRFLDYLESLIAARKAYLQASLRVLDEEFAGFPNYAREILELTDGDIQQLKECYLED